MHLRRPVDYITTWLAVPELAALPAVDQAEIADQALQTANAKHPQGFNVPALLSAIALLTITLICLGPGWLHGGRLYFVILIAIVEFIASVSFGWWWWRISYSHEFKKTIRRGIASRACA